jgi:sugar/nucleoside kinase (ribokinase family)
MTSIGADAGGIIDILRRHKVGASHVGISDTKTGKHILVHAPGGSSSLLYDGANRHMLTSPLDLNALNNAGSVYLAPGPRGLPERVMPHLMDVQLFCQLTPQFPLGMLTGSIDMLFAPADLAMSLTAAPCPAEAAVALASMGPKAAIVNDRGAVVFHASGGESGALVLDRDDTYDASLYLAPFVAGCISRYVRTSNISTSVAYGMACQEMAHDARKRIVLFDDMEALDERMYHLARYHQ